MSSLHFSDKPGRRERQLQRRCRNPLFSDEQQHVTRTQLDQAREADQQEVREFAEALKSLLTEVSAFSAREETDRILETKQRADRLYEQCIGLAGEHERERQGLLKLNDVIMSAIRQAAGQDALALQELENEQQARDIHMALLQYPMVADLLWPDNELEEDELLPTILSADAEAIQMAMTLFSAEQRAVLLQQAASLQQKLQQRGQLDALMQGRFEALAAATQ